MGDSQSDHEWGRYLRRLTKSRNPTIKDLAERAGLSRQTVSEYIRDGAESVTIGIVRRVAEAAGDDFINALLAAGNIKRDALDDEIALALEADFDDETKMLIVQELEEMKAADEQLLAEMARRDKDRRRVRMTALIEQARRSA